jgi:hypothetical protein
MHTFLKSFLSIAGSLHFSGLATKPASAQFSSTAKAEAPLDPATRDFMAYLPSIWGPQLQTIFNDLMKRAEDMAKRLSPLKGIFLMVALPVVGGFSAKAENVSVGSAIVKSIDVEDLLAKSLSINRTPRPAEDCACRDCNVSGMRAKHYCKIERQFRDLKVERIIEISVAPVDVSKLPSYRKDERLEFENYWLVDPYPFKEDATYETEQSAQVNLSEVLTNVSDFTSSITFDARIFDAVGIKRDDKTGNSVTFQTTKSTTRSMVEKFTIRKPIEFTVPPCTRRWADYSDTKKDIKVPVKITGVLSGRVVDFVAGFREFPVMNLKDVPAEKRMFEISGNVELFGSSRSLSVRLGEARLTDGACAKK